MAHQDNHAAHAVGFKDYLTGFILSVILTVIPFALVMHPEVLGLSRGATLITVVHQPALLPLLADRVIGLRDGALEFDLPIAQVDAERLQALYASSLSPMPIDRCSTPNPCPTPALTACLPTLQRSTP